MIDEQGNEIGEDLARKIEELAGELTKVTEKEFKDPYDDWTAYGKREHDKRDFNEITEAIAVYNMVLKELGKDDEYRAMIKNFEG